MILKFISFLLAILFVNGFVKPRQRKLMGFFYLSNSPSREYVNEFMQPYHAEAIVNAEGKIVLTLPFRAGVKVDVLVVLSDDDERSWQELVARKFFEGYSDEDAAYDNYKV